MYNKFLALNKCGILILFYRYFHSLVKFEAMIPDDAGIPVEELKEGRKGEMFEKVSITPRLVKMSDWSVSGGGRGPNGSRGTWSGSTLLLLIACQSCSSDYNVVIPEICHLPASVRVNLTWVHEMVHLGIRDEERGIVLNLARPEGKLMADQPA